jgi:hypothetical protein
MENRDLINIGFKKIEYFTVGNIVIYDLGRNRHLTASSVGTPNEYLFICNTDETNPKKITDIITLHNYDYDGYLTLEKVKNLIYLLDGNKKQKS